MPDIPTMSLKTAMLNPVVFTPAQYQFQTADMGILERSLAQRESRMEKASQIRSAMDKTLGELEMKLNPAETAWFNQYKDNIANDIQSSIDIGDYGKVIRFGTEAAGNVLSDTQILGRIKANQDYKTFVQSVEDRVKNKNISQNTADWYLNKNKYNYTDIRDDNGNIISGTEFKPSTRLYDDLDIKQNAFIAFKLLSSDKYTNAGGHSTTNEDGTGDGRKFSYSYEKVSSKDILNRMEDIVSNSPDGMDAAYQMFQVAIHNYEKLQKEIKANPSDVNLRQKKDKMDELMIKNGDLIDYKTYYARVIADELLAKGLAYDWRTDNDFVSNDHSLNLNGSRPGSGSGNGNNNNGNSVPTYGDWYIGPHTREEQDYSNNQTDLDNSVSAIEEHFIEQ